MKKFKTTFLVFGLLLACGLFLTSCDKDEPIEPVNPNQIITLDELSTGLWKFVQLEYNNKIYLADDIVSFYDLKNAGKVGYRYDFKLTPPFSDEYMMCEGRFINYYIDGGEFQSQDILNTYDYSELSNNKLYFSEMSHDWYEVLSYDKTGKILKIKMISSGSIIDATCVGGIYTFVNE